ncbi:MAG TPA: hypothetical protein VL576_02350 [Candidatus Paceibacterota bacterium]|nr:hypothetical protein [Candidatus Paceibacterota bacterium]
MAFFDYGNKIVQKAIWELKYHHKSAAAKILAQHGAPEVIEFLSSLLQSTTPTKIVLVPIPQHYTKTFQRGFNQSALIAKWLSRYIPSTEVRPMIKKHRSTIPQAKAMSKAERQKNLKGSMRATQKLDRKTLYILVDDVITTSSTINEASRALCAAGARNICAVAIAHGHANRFN